MGMCLQRFLRENGLQLVIRSHEGPDARYDRDDMPPMIPGFSVDHVTASADHRSSHPLVFPLARAHHWLA